ncbi:Double-stranded RNA-binding 4 [Melia azedarach]|uniref:Double-stranded RNA-binding 4 n=1 Tax=Melia azedarach TaxID=155640 RepID=A0ACC1XQ99_MELAZ|nr:Double-stranded RNA-binding 4 [Melia azedarach]
MKLKKPEYTTTPRNNVRLVFISTLVFNGQVYKGEVGGSKKMAEQLAARAAIQSLLESDPGLLREIINSKVKKSDRAFKFNESGFDRSNLQTTVKPEVSMESSKKTIVTSPSTANVKSLGQNADSNRENKRKREPENAN